MKTGYHQTPKNSLFKSADKLRTEAVTWRLLPFEMVFKYKESIHN